MAFITIFHEYIAGLNPIYSASDREYKRVHGCSVVLQHCLGTYLSGSVTEPSC